LKSFFTVLLGVTTPSLEMHVKGLKEKASVSPDYDDIKQRIRNICQYCPEPKDLKDLSDCKCLPISHSNRNLKWMSAKEDFAIVDRKEYKELLANKIDFLNFSLEEVHKFKPFLEGLGLQSQYLSQLVELRSSAEGDEVNERLTSNLQRKAYAICR
jgi:hypothetical protein